MPVTLSWLKLWIAYWSSLWTLTEIIPEERRVSELLSHKETSIKLGGQSNYIVIITPQNHRIIVSI